MANKNRIRQARIISGLSLRELSDKMSVDGKISRQALHKYETGVVVPDSKMIGRLSEATEMSQDFFYKEDCKVKLGELKFSRGVDYRKNMM